MSRFSLRLFALCILLTCAFQSVLQAETREHCKELIDSGEQARYQKKYAESLELLDKARDLAETNNWYEELFEALNYMAINYAEMMDHAKALEYFLSAHGLELKGLVSGKETKVLNNVAVLYAREGDLDKAEEYFKKAYTKAVEIRNLESIALYASNLAEIANDTERLDLAEEYINEALSISRNLDNAYTYIATVKTKINNLYLRGKYNMAEEEAFELLSVYKKNHSNVDIDLLISISKIFWKKGDIDSAVVYAKQALEAHPNLENKIKIYELFSTLYQEKELFKQAILYKDSVIITKDLLHKIKNERFFENNQIKFELQNSRMELLQNSEKQKTERLIYSFTIVFIIVLSTILIWALRINFVREKQRKKIAQLELEKEKKDRLLLEKQLQEQETIALLEQERLKNEIDRKNKELIVNAMFLSTRNDLIEHIVNSLTQSSEVSKNKTLLNNIHELKKQLKENSEWDGFLAHFETINSDFLKKIKEKHPNLTVNEIRFLSYIYINLNTKEIASLLNITSEACRKRKQFIAIKRLGLTSSSLLYNYLSSL